MKDFFHVHLYYDANSFETAQRLLETISDQFGYRIGHMHQQPVGPHPEWSCQVNLPADNFGQFIPWLSQNRQGLTVFIHPQTGNDWLDHTEHAMWMGNMPKLNLSIFEKPAEN